MFSAPVFIKRDKLDKQLERTRVDERLVSGDVWVAAAA